MHNNKLKFLFANKGIKISKQNVNPNQNCSKKFDTSVNNKLQS